MNKRKVTREEQKQIWLSMLKEIDSFCRDHNLKYSLAYGTLIGAIRHKGFIPWDDDVDIMMPEPDVDILKRELESDTLGYVDIDVEPYYNCSFSRICYKPTFSQPGISLRSYGLSIDLYPVLGLTSDKREQERFVEKGTELRRKAQFLSIWRNRIIRRIPIKTIPFYKKSLRVLRDYVQQYSYNNSKYFFINGGPVEWGEVYDYDLFADMTEVEFEGNTFMSVACYDKYLRDYYGDYMQLPPEDERHPYHGGTYYWK